MHCWQGKMDKERGMLNSFEELSLNLLAHVVDEKPIPPFTF
jgi:hypothetical protein